MDLLNGVIRSYDWGSTTALSDLRGVEPSGQPEAEFWFGAHRSGPSSFRADGRLATSAEMPFLVKVLAVDRPLSLQLHPDGTAARVGRRREEAAGVLVGDPRRCFPDGRAKPEAVCALGQFETLCGFRPIPEALEMATMLSLPERVLSSLRSGDWPIAVASALAASPEEVAVVAAAAEAGDGSAANLVDRLAVLHHGDPALLLVPLLRHHVLDDGDLLYVPPGVLHAHLSGLAVEVMADSDDVVRAGLTSKFVDPIVLVDLLRPERLFDVEMATGPVHCYDLEVDDLVLRRLTGTRLDVEVGGSDGPELLLCTDGSASVHSEDGGSDLVVLRGEAAWIGPEDGLTDLRVDGTVHWVTCRDLGRRAQ